MVTLTGFAPGTNGLHYANSWPSEPDVSIATPFGDIPIGDASNGLCGGMAFAAADLFVAKRMPPETTENPPSGSPAFDYIVRRLIDSFNIPVGVAEYYEWMVLGREDVGFGAGHPRDVVSHGRGGTSEAATGDRRGQAVPARADPGQLDQPGRPRQEPPGPGLRVRRQGQYDDRVRV